MAARSSSLQLEGAPVKASTAAWVGICRYGIGVSFFSTGTSDALACLCSAAAFFAPLIFEKIDMLVVTTGEAGEVKSERRGVGKRVTGGRPRSKEHRERGRLRELVE